MIETKTKWMWIGTVAAFVLYVVAIILFMASGATRADYESAKNVGLYCMGWEFIAFGVIATIITIGYTLGENMKSKD